jgi:hypothetical protein
MLCSLVNCEAAVPVANRESDAERGFVFRAYLAVHFTFHLPITTAQLHNLLDLACFGIRNLICHFPDHTGGIGLTWEMNEILANRDTAS